MTLKVTIPITNAGKTRRRFVIPKGMLVEVSTPGMQNVVTSESVTGDLGPGETKTVEVEGYCVNRDKAWPNNADGKLTKRTFGLPFSSQADIWQGIASPDMNGDPTADLLRKLRREMVNLVSRHGNLTIIAADLGVKKYDELRDYSKVTGRIK